MSTLADGDQLLFGEVKVTSRVAADPKITPRVKDHKVATRVAGNSKVSARVERSLQANIGGDFNDQC